MRKNIKPQKLNHGATIGLIAPSHYIDAKRLQNIEKRLYILKKHGFHVHLGKSIFLRYYNSAGKPEERASDLNSMFADRKIKAIFCAIGGNSSNQILPYIDYKLIKNNPKILLGFSDITNLLFAIHCKTSLVTFHGPCFNDFYKLTNEAEYFLSDLLSLTKSLPGYPGGMKIIKHGTAKGKLLGGNLFIINSLLATNYLPNFNRAILFWEEIIERAADIEFQLYQLKLSGVLNKISGMIIGHIPYNKSGRPFLDIILELTTGLKFPIIKVNYFGHGLNNFYTMPVGINAFIDTGLRQFKLAEAAVI